MVKTCQHNGIGVYEVKEKYILTHWMDTGEVLKGKTFYKRKVVEKIKCPHCKALFLRGFFEIESFEE